MRSAPDSTGAGRLSALIAHAPPGDYQLVLSSKTLSYMGVQHILLLVLCQSAESALLLEEDKARQPQALASMCASLRALHALHTSEVT